MHRSGEAGRESGGGAEVCLTLHWTDPHPHHCTYPHLFETLMLALTFDLKSVCGPPTNFFFFLVHHINLYFGPLCQVVR